MPSSLERRLDALEGKPRVYRSIAETPDEFLLEMLAPHFGGRVPTDDELQAFIAKSEKNHAST